MPGAAALMQGWRILSLHVISQRESKNGPHLIALCTNGLRLYFSPSPVGYGYGYGAPSYADAKQLTLVHVRLPPSNLLHPDEQVNTQQRQPGNAYGVNPTQVNSRTCSVANLTTSTYVDGILVTAQPSDVDGKDFLLGVVPDLSKVGVLGQAQPSNAGQQPAGLTNYFNTVGQQRTPRTEQATMLYVEGTVCAIGCVPRPIAPSAPSPGQPADPLTTNEFAIQFSEPRQDFVVITNVGISFLTKRRAIDYLRDAIEELGSEGNFQHMLDFRDRYVLDLLFSFFMT